MSKQTIMQQAIKEIADLWSSPSDTPNYTKIFEVLESKLKLENQQRQEDTNFGYSQGYDDRFLGREAMRPTVKD